MKRWHYSSLLLIAIFVFISSTYKGYSNPITTVEGNKQNEKIRTIDLGDTEKRVPSPRRASSQEVKYTPIPKQLEEQTEPQTEAKQEHEVLYGALVLLVFVLVIIGFIIYEKSSNINDEFPERPKKMVDKISEFTFKSLIQIRQLIKDAKIKYYLHIGLSTFVGFFLGWYFKVPNTKLMSMLLKANSLWKKDLALEYHRKKSGFFSTELFSFNWIVFIFSTLLCFFILMYLNDVKFRQHIQDKLNSLKLKGR